MIFIFQRLEQWKDRERLAQQKKQQLLLEIDRLNNKIAQQTSVIKNLEGSLEKLENVLEQLQTGNIYLQNNITKL